MTDTIIYEYPLTEKIRGYLRIEHLSEQLFNYKTIDNPVLFRPFFSLLFTLSEQFDRGELKKELIRDLDCNKLLLNKWKGNVNIEQEQLNKLLAQINSFTFSQAQSNKVHSVISQDPLLSQVKNKLSLSGGGSPFDTPLLHHWNHLPLEKRLEDIDNWLSPFIQTIEAIKLLLQLIRETSIYSEHIAIEGFYKNSCEKLQLLRIKTMKNTNYYPVISGYKNRYSVRFQSPYEQPVPDIKFLLSCC